jgi:predicted RNA binding protein YcfA (HicA-like mRNA interferase family)
MGKKEKLWQKAKNSPQNLTFSEFETLLTQCGWQFSRQQGSHRLWYSPNNNPLPIQPKKDGKAKLYQVKQFIDYQEELDK